MHSAILKASKGRKMSKPGTACQRKCIILVTPQKLEVIKRLESGTS